MKKVFALLTIAILAISVSQAQRLTVTATKKNGLTSQAGTYELNPNFIQDVTNASSPVISYQDPLNAKNVITYTVSNSFDTIYNRANKYGAKLVKVLVSSIIPGTTRDTLIQWAFPVNSANERKAVTVAGQASAKSQVYFTRSSGYKKLYLGETLAILNARIDSLYEIANNPATTSYDTSNYTLKLADKHIVLNSTTADTLTLLDPAQYSAREAIVVANIGSGAYTLAGGFTVKDKSGSTVSSLTANTVYTFKSYYTGAAYIWLKEY